MNERAAKRARIFPGPVPQPSEARASVVLPEGHAGLAADAPAAGDVADAGLAADGPAADVADVPIDAGGHGVIALDDPGAPHIVACMCRACLGGDDVPLEAEV